jgi:hypothetical protein
VTENVPYTLLHFAYETHGAEMDRSSALPMIGHGLGPGGKGNRWYFLLSRYFFRVKTARAATTKMMAADIMGEGIQITGLEIHLV